MDLHVARTVTDLELRTFFERSALVEAVTILSEGEALVSFASKEDAKKALEEFDGHSLAGRVLSVRYALPRKEREADFEPGQDRV